MSYIRLANFFQLYRLNGSNERNEGRYHNAMPGTKLSYGGLSYQYLSFAYQGAAKNRTGDNLEAQLQVSVNEISSGIAAEAVRNRWHVRMYSAVLTQAGAVSRILTTEEWMASSLTYDNEVMEIVLSSGVDAVGANAPTKVLTRQQVGSLPITASIRAQ
ncbi:MAG: hypothetical protein VXX72_08130 [Pseudomonadota bacterium]|nr:hypothetical protein [Pseudomonadota bacterium]